MPLPKNQNSKFTYHVMIRGHKSSKLFYDEKDYSHYLSLLTKLKSAYIYDLHAYSMVPNQIHLLIETFKTNVSMIIKRIHSNYAIYYNQKHSLYRSGFQSQYVSQLIKDETHFFQSSRFIHLIPQVQKVTQNIGDYRWSSAQEYLSPQMDEGTIHPYLTLNRTLQLFPHPKHEHFHQFLNSTIQV